MPHNLLKKRSSPEEQWQGGRKALDEFEQALILETLQKHDGKFQDTANEMGIYRAALWRKMKKMKIA